MTKFSEKLKELRICNNLLQRDLAKILEVNPRTVSNWEVAINEPDFSMLVKIAKYFEVTTDYLLGIEN